MITYIQMGIDVSYASDLLSCSELVAIPTETVYGLAANAYDINAVRSIFAVKRRPSYDPLILHTDCIAKVEEFTYGLLPEARALAQAFWPGPLTLLLPKKPIVPDTVTSGLQTVAVRVPNHPLTLDLLRRLSFPLAAPSANPFGYISPTSPQHVLAQLGHSVKYVLDGGTCAVGIESTIVGFPNGVPTVFRLGGLSVEAIENVIGKVAVVTHSCSNPMAPGLLQNHYAPRTPLFMFTPDWGTFIPERTGYLAMHRYYEGIPYHNQVVLSPNYDLNQAAHNLFAGLRHLDSLGLGAIYGEWAPLYGLGLAINDRLKRASARNFAYLHN